MHSNIYLHFNGQTYMLRESHTKVDELHRKIYETTEFRDTKYQKITKIFLIL